MLTESEVIVSIFCEGEIDWIFIGETFCCPEYFPAATELEGSVKIIGRIR